MEVLSNRDKRAPEIDKRNYFAVVSRKAGRFREEIVKEIINAFAREGLTVDFLPIREDINLEKEIQQAYNQGYRSFLAIGGDGTVNLLASSLYDKPHRLGIIPVGTTNTLARILGVPIVTGESIKIAATSQKTRPIDGLEVNGKIFLLNVSMGLSSISLDSVDAGDKSKLGIFAYILGIIRNYKRITPNNYNIRIDDIAYKISAIELHITNIGVIGVPQLSIFPGSQIDDGRAEVLALKRRSAFELLQAAVDILTRRKRQAIRLIGRGKNIYIQSEKPISIQADGDILQQTPLTIKVLRQAINIIVP